jgi:hypothetical protein
VPRGALRKAVTQGKKAEGKLQHRARQAVARSCEEALRKPALRNQL